MKTILKTIGAIIHGQILLCVLPERLSEKKLRFRQDLQLLKTEWLEINKKG
jgi:hypothetical protein